jgi:hypothetical protein
MATPIFTSSRNYVRPKCKAAVGDRCRSPSGRLAEYPHNERSALISPREVAQAQVAGVDLPGLLRKL